MRWLVALALLIALPAPTALAQVDTASVAGPAELGAGPEVDTVTSAGFGVTPDAGLAPADAATEAPDAAPEAPEPPRLEPVRKVRVPQRRAGKLEPADAGARAAEVSPAAEVEPEPPPSPPDAGAWSLTRPAGPPPPPAPPSSLESAPAGVTRAVEAVEDSGIAEALLWVLLIGAALVAGRTAALLAELMTAGGMLPALLRLFGTAMRGLALLLVIFLLVEVVPAVGRHWALWLGLLVGLLVLAGRDLLRDVLAHFVLRFEGRVRVGQRLRAGEVEGRVANVGLRATRIVDGAGRAVDVPNHLLLESPIFAESGAWPTREVALRLPDGQGAILREAIIDAARASPWVPVDAEVTARRDATNPSLWTLRAQILDAKFAERFAGEISEQVEARLQAFEDISSTR